MKKVLTIAAATLLSATSLAYAAGTQKPGASGMAPGHEMQSGSTRGASENTPGDAMRDKGTVGMSKGASEYSPGDRMNDKRKK